MQSKIMILFVVMNIIGFFMMGIDKRKAKKNKWRIRERDLFVVAAIGGSIGSIVGMYFFRHKTKHKSFFFGMPLILLLQILILMAYLFYF